MIPAKYSSLLKQDSLLTLLFSEAELDQYLATLEINQGHAQEIIGIEGSGPDSLLILLSGELELIADIHGMGLSNGMVLPGRSVNTYAVLRELPYQYSARFKMAGDYLKFPLSAVREALQKKPKVAQYLLSMTEGSDVRGLAKEMDSLGCSTNFKLDFISSLTEKDFHPQEWLIGAQESFSEIFFIREGRVISRSLNLQSSGNINQPLVPTRIWIGWHQLENKKLSDRILVAVTQTKVLSLSEKAWLQLKENFPEDFSKYARYIKDGRVLEAADEAENEELDLQEIVSKKSSRRFFWQAYPWVQQNDGMDCGPACLAMVSQYHGRKVSIQFWRGQLSTNREGTSLFDMAKTTERCGFISYGLAVENICDLDQNFLPVIALRKYHYLVVYKVTNQYVTVGNPAVGIVRMSHAEFQDGFEKSVLFLQPQEGFKNLPATQGQYKHFFQLLGGLEKEMLLSLLISLMTVGLGLIIPILSQVFMDDILVRRDLDLLKTTLAASLAVTVMLGFLNWARNYYENYLAAKFDYRAHSVFLKKMLSLDYKFFAERHVGDFTRRFEEMEKIKRFLLHSAELVISSILSLAIYSAALLFYAPKIALTVLISTPIFFLISWLTGRTLSKIYQKVFTESAELSSSLTDTIRGISAIKSLGAELASRWRYEEKLVSLLKAERKFSLTASSIGVFSDFYSHLVNAAIMAFAAYLAIQGELSPGQVVAVTMIAGNVLSPLTKLAGQFGEIQEIIAVFNRLNDVLLAPSEKVSDKGRLRKDNLRGDIEFRDVWFRYGGEGSDWVLKGVSFKIEAGSHVAFVGPSGSGKSTIAALIGRMYEPTRGQILIDDRDYLDYEIDWLRSQIGFLHQESHLFQGSIAENIAFAESEIDFDRMQEAARKAAAEDFISKKAGSFSYPLSNGGMGLSGGEKQRIALARCFYRNPRMMVLDEATSALDGIAERSLMENIAHGLDGATMINIAHRYSTVMFSDFALVLSQGKVVGFGSHEELEAQNQIYQELFLPQKTAQPLIDKKEVA